MPDDTSKQGDEDRRRVAAGEPYEVAYFARRHGLTIEQAQALIAEVGNDRAALDAAADRRNADRDPG